MAKNFTYYLKSSLFVEHIKEHLKENQKVVCKICNKSIDIIYNERINLYHKSAIFSRVFEENLKLR